MVCIKRSLLRVRSFSKGRIFESRKRGEVCVRDFDLVIILIAFFCKIEILFKAVWGAQLMMMEQYKRWGWNIEK
jgi:hypothetical protein